MVGVVVDVSGDTKGLVVYKGFLDLLFKQNLAHRRDVIFLLVQWRS